MNDSRNRNKSSAVMFVVVISMTAGFLASLASILVGRADHNNWTNASHNGAGWYVGDFNGDRKDDIFRQMNSSGGAEVLLSNGLGFDFDGVWSNAGHNGHAWYVGDFDGDGTDDIFRQMNQWGGAEVFLSDRSSFVFQGLWTNAGSNGADWYVGDFNGDGKDDLFRQLNEYGGAEVFLSNGNGFEFTGVWTGAHSGGNRWYVGDFDGDGDDDIFRQLNQWGGAEVFLSDRSAFIFDGRWTGYGHRGYDWHIGDYDGDGADDIFRQINQWGGAEVFLAKDIDPSETTTDYKFVCTGCGDDGYYWTGYGHRGFGWTIGDFMGNGRFYDEGGRPIKKADIFRQMNQWGGAEMFGSSGTAFHCALCGEFMFDGVFTGTVTGDNGSSAPATVVLSQSLSTGDQITAAITITGAGLEINAGGLCRGNQPVISGFAFGPLTLFETSSARAEGATQQEIMGKTVTTSLVLTLDQTGHNLSGSLDLDLPSPCRDSTITGTFSFFSP